MRFSVIIPAYNSERTLARCLDSVLRQKFQDYEVIIVDDGSTDKTKSIIESYKLKDSRIIGITKENGGASSARNTGMNNATGDYIVFLDSDDEVSSEYLYDLSGYNEDCIISGITVQREYTQHNENPPKNSVYNKEDIPTFIEINNLGSYLRGPCAKALKRQIISNFNIRFDTNMLWGEDFLFMLEFLKHSNGIRTICKANYIYYWPSDELKYKMTANHYMYGLHKIEYAIRTFGTLQTALMNNRIGHYATFIRYLCSLSRKDKFKNISILLPYKLWHLLPDISFYYKSARYFEVLRITLFTNIK